jgi:hypothetical protein
MGEGGDAIGQQFLCFSAIFPKVDTLVGQAG